MSKFTPKNLNSGFADIDSLNENFNSLATFSDTCLSRDGTSPNTMLSNLDMNSYRILNLPDAVTANEPATLGQVLGTTAVQGFVSTVVEKQIATASQTVFTLTLTTYTPGVDNISVYINGAYQDPSVYVQTSSTVVTLVEPAAEDDEVVFVVNQRNVSADTFPAASVTYTDHEGNNTNVKDHLDRGAEGVEYIPAGVGAVPTNVQTKLRETVSVADFGASAAAAGSVNRLAIQAAIDYMYSLGGGTVLLEDIYPVDTISYTMYPSGTAIRSIVLKDGVNLVGKGNETGFFVEASAYGPGAFYNCITSDDTPGSMLRNCTVRDFSIDGNKTNQVASTQCSNMLIYAERFVRVENINSFNSNGQGIQVVGHTTTYAEDITITGNHVTDVTGIGIQVSQFNRLNISNNSIYNCTDNAIDIYGEDGDTTPHGRNFSITGNTIETAQTGIFLETVEDGVVTGNSIRDINAGTAQNACIQVNRINGEPANIAISGNIGINAGYGFFGSGVTSGVLVTGNKWSDMSTAYHGLGTAGATTSQYVITNNMCEGTATPWLITAGVDVTLCKGFMNYAKGPTIQSLGASAHTASNFDDFLDWQRDYSFTDVINSEVADGTKQAFQRFYLNDAGGVPQKYFEIETKASGIAPADARVYLRSMVGGTLTTWLEVDTLGRIYMGNLPTSNPGGTGILWNNAGVVNIT